MKIIEWNCQGAFRNKNDQILKLNPDILIVPECENEEKLKFGKLTKKPNDFFWYGDNPNKGIAIFSYSTYKFELLKEFNPKFRYIIPLKVYNEKESFILFAIWAMDNKKNPLARYIGQIWLAINYYSDLFNYNTILIGDFNSNQIWDEKERVGNHTHVVDKLKENGIHSLYHEKNNCEHGKELNHTFFMYRKKEKPYHIDYCFASKHFTENNYQLTIENCDNWISQSDHVPMIIKFNNKLEKIKFQNSLKESLERKFNKLSTFTNEKFKDIIISTLIKAEKIDRENLFEKGDLKKEKVIEIAEKLIEIDKLVTEIKNVG